MPGCPIRRARKAGAVDSVTGEVVLLPRLNHLKSRALPRREHFLEDLARKEFEDKDAHRTRTGKPALAGGRFGGLK